MRRRTSATRGTVRRPDQRHRCRAGSRRHHRRARHARLSDAPCGPATLAYPTDPSPVPDGREHVVVREEQQQRCPTHVDRLGLVAQLVDLGQVTDAAVQDHEGNQRDRDDLGEFMPGAWRGEGQRADRDDERDREDQQLSSVQFVLVDEQNDTEEQPPCGHEDRRDDDVAHEIAPCDTRTVRRLLIRMSG